MAFGYLGRMVSGFFVTGKNDNPCTSWSV